MMGLTYDNGFHKAFGERKNNFALKKELDIERFYRRGKTPIATWRGKNR